jgi:alpha-L-fucosidase
MSDTQTETTQGSARDALRLAPEDLAWWQDAKFGMFIHWGLYAIPARGEWVMHREQIPAEEYAKLADAFAPRHFDAGAWAQLARDAGMRYSVLTARHHDGFALWDSPASYGQFTSVATAAKRDFVAAYVSACREAGLGTGLYYSPMDWRLPGYFHPKELPDNAALMKAQGYGQVEELMTRYGPIDILWYDGGWLAHKGTDRDAAWFWEPEKLNAMVRRHQPKIVISPRSGWEGDFGIDEGGHGVTGPIAAAPWEKCCNLNRPSWGYNAEQDLMTADEIILMLVNTVGRGGNLLLNVGPDCDGVIPAEHTEVLREVGDWLRRYGESIYGTRPGPFQPVEGRMVSTFRGDSVYVHVLDWRDEGLLVLPALDRQVASASLLSGGDVACAQADGQTMLTVPFSESRPTPAVIELVLHDAGARVGG